MMRTLNSNNVALDNVHLADAVEYGYTGAEQRCVFCSINIVGNADYSLCTKIAIFGVSAIAAHAVDELVLTHLV